MEHRARSLRLAVSVVLMGTSAYRVAGQILAADMVGLSLPGRFIFDLASESLAARLTLGSSGADFVGLSLGADEESADLRCALRIRGETGSGGSFIAVGPGAPSGSLRLLSDPLSSGLLSSRGGPVALSPSLESGTAVLGLGVVRPAPGGVCDESFEAFALAGGAGGGLLLRRAQFAESSEDIPFEPRYLAAGLGGGVSDGEGRWSALVAASARRGTSGSGGWEPDIPADPAGLVLHGALVRERWTESTRVLFGFVASAGRLEGPGLAARIEADAREGPLFLRIAASRAGTGFRVLSGSYPERSLSLAGDIRLALKRASSLTCALRLEMPRTDAGDPPLFGGSARCAYSLPLYAGDGTRVLWPRLELSRSPGADVRTELGFGLKGKRDGKGTNLDLALLLGGENGMDGLRVALDSATRGAARGLGADFELGLSWLEEGDPNTAPRADAALRLEFPLPAPSAGRTSLRLELSCPEGGVILAPFLPDEAAPILEWSIRYVAEL